jgi:hypothetical protein
MVYAEVIPQTDYALRKAIHQCDEPSQVLCLSRAQARATAKLKLNKAIENDP